MLISAILSLRMVITNENQPEMMRLSATIPVLGFFHTRRCGHCTVVEPVWANLTERYENDSSLLLVDCECTENLGACDKTSRMASFPTFLLIHNGNTAHIRIENRTLENFVDIVEEIKGWNPEVPCQRWFNQTDRYPYLVLSWPDDEITACNKLIELESRIPGFAYRMFLGKREDEMKVTFIMQKHDFQPYLGPLDDEFISYANDYLHPSIGSWPVEESETITHRRFGILIYNESSQLRSAQEFGRNQSANYAFTSMNLTTFLADYPQLAFEEDDLPALAVFNTEKTSFVIVLGASFDQKLKDYFGEMVHAWDMEEPMIPRKTVAPRQDL
jgi:hypothetical protein